MIVNYKGKPCLVIEKYKPAKTHRSMYSFDLYYKVLFENKEIILDKEFRKSPIEVRNINFYIERKELEKI